MPHILIMSYFIIAAAVVVLDQITKYLVRTDIPEGSYIDVLGSFFRLTHFENDGAAFSMLGGQTLFLIAVPVIAVIAATVYIFRTKRRSPVLIWALALITGGGIGNLIDRATAGTVTDMFSFSIFPPIFNVADVGVTTGCILLVFYVIFEERLEKNGKGK